MGRTKQANPKRRAPADPACAGGSPKRWVPDLPASVGGQAPSAVTADAPHAEVVSVQAEVVAASTKVDSSPPVGAASTNVDSSTQVGAASTKVDSSTQVGADAVDASVQVGVVAVNAAAQAGVVAVNASSQAVIAVVEMAIQADETVPVDQDDGDASADDAGVENDPSEDSSDGHDGPLDEETEGDQMTPSNDHVCPKCHRSFAQKRNIDRHLKSTCTENRAKKVTWNCRHCGLACVAKANCTLHESRCPYSKNLVCSCGRAFERVGNYNNHVYKCVKKEEDLDDSDSDEDSDDE